MDIVAIALIILVNTAAILLGLYLIMRAIAQRLDRLIEQGNRPGTNGDTGSTHPLWIQTLHSLYADLGIRYEEEPEDIDDVIGPLGSLVEELET